MGILRCSWIISLDQSGQEAFLPKMNFMCSRWENILEPGGRDIDLPPVELYKIGKCTLSKMAITVSLWLVNVGSAQYRRVCHPDHF